MNGRLRKRGKRSWELSFDLPKQADGERRRKWENVKGTKAEAQQRLRELITEAEGGLVLNTTKTTVETYLLRWLDSHAHRVRKRTIYGYRNYVKRYMLPALGGTRLTQLEPAAIEHLYASMLKVGLSAMTVRHTHRMLKKALKQAVRWNLIPRNPTDMIDPPAVQRKEMLTLDSEQLRALLAHAQATSPMYGPAIYLAAHTGMRRGELVGLKWTDIDSANAIIAVSREIVIVPGQGHLITPPKSAQGRRSIAIPPVVVAELKLHRAAQAEHRLRVGPAWADEDWVFTRPDGRHLHADELTRVFKNLREDLELPPVRLHDLRHTHATLMLKAGVHLKVVQERLGHSTVAITGDTYSHVTPGLQRSAAESFERVLSE